MHEFPGSFVIRGLTEVTAPCGLRIKQQATSSTVSVRRNNHEPHVKKNITVGFNRSIRTSYCINTPTMTSNKKLRARGTKKERKARAAAKRPPPPPQGKYPNADPKLIELVYIFLKEHGYLKAVHGVRVHTQKREATGGYTKPCSWTGAARGLPTLQQIFEEWEEDREIDNELGIDPVGHKAKKGNAKEAEAKADQQEKELEATANANTNANTNTGADAGADAKVNVNDGEKGNEGDDESKDGSDSSDESEVEDKPLSSAASVPSKSAEIKKASSPSSSNSSNCSSDSSSSSSDSSSSSSEETPKPVVKTLKRKASASSSSSSSGSDSSSSSSSGSSSDSDSAPPAKKTKKAKSSSSDSSSNSSSSSDSSSDSSSSDSDSSNAAKVTLPDSSSSSSDTSDSSSPKKPIKSKEKKSSNKENKSSTTKEKKSYTNKTQEAVPEPERTYSTSSATLAGSSSPQKRKLSPSATLPPTKSQSTTERFSRIPKDQYVDPKFASNEYVSYDYADRAHADLIVTKGKSFTKEKNKKKRGSYRGGVIDTSGGGGIKFED
ncbi:hypothetical protein M501DRAFT_376797 [Patellaria atrata CBS 101060]|uniref:Srp40 C-terminal domain-containing protein n=1 Tax=Patellaria atrata CBS 101060 TaxID=1346257 RepID=A0A9P4SG32_9PEZI|nr:hypothetical protein M501DRAFT_376797 [Patellaria atrata CBS 101060]